LDDKTNGKNMTPADKKHAILLRVRIPLRRRDATA
jgi:hypothetical protein